MAITFDDENNSNHSRSSSTHSSSHMSETKNYDDLESEESDGGWSDEDGDSDTEDHEEDLLLSVVGDGEAIGEQATVHNQKKTGHKSKSKKGTKPATAIIAASGVAASTHNSNDDALDQQRLKLAMQEKRREAMQQQQQAIVAQEQVIKSPQMNGQSVVGGVIAQDRKGKKASIKSPRSEKERLKVEEPAEELSESSSEEDGASESESESSEDESTSSEEESSSDEDSDHDDEHDNGHAIVDEVARQEQNVKTVQQVMKVDEAAHERFLAFMRKKNQGTLPHTNNSSTNNVQASEEPHKPASDASPRKNKYTGLGSSIGHLHSSLGEIHAPASADEQQPASSKTKKKKDKKKKDKKKKEKEKEKERRKKIIAKGGFDWKAYLDESGGKASSKKDKKVPKRTKSEGASKKEKKKKTSKGVQRSKSDAADMVGSPVKKRAGKKPSKAPV